MLDRAVPQSLKRLYFIVFVLVLAACSSSNQPSVSHTVYISDDAGTLSYPLAGVTVTAFNSDDLELASALTDSDGVAHLSLAADAAVRYGFELTGNPDSTLVCETEGDSSVCLELPVVSTGGGVSFGELDLSALTNGTYLVVASHSDKCMDVAAYSRDNGGNIHQWACHGQTNQQWRVTPLGDDVYTLTSVLSSKVVDVSGISREQGSNVHQWTYVGGANQQWRATEADGGYRFSAQHSGYCLDVYGGSRANGASYIQWPCRNPDATGNQTFKLVPVGGEPQPNPPTPNPPTPNPPAGQLIERSSYRVKNVGSGLCLNVAAASQENGRNINQQNCSAHTNRNWSFTHLGDNVYRIAANHSGKVLDVSRVSTSPGANVHQWVNLGNDNQQWRAQTAGTGFRFRALHSDLCLEVSGASKNAGASLVQNTCSGSAAQQFTLTASTPNTGGAWATRQNWPLIATHMANLPDGQVVAWSSWDVDRFGGGASTPNETEAVVYNPATGRFSEADNPDHDMFCAGLAVLGDGRVFAAGGGDDVRQVSFFNGNSWSAGPTMNEGRWYNTAVALPTGGAFTAVGRGTGINTAEVWRGSGGWDALGGVDMSDVSGQALDTPGWYPYMHVDPRGNIFHSGGTSTMHTITVGGEGSKTALGERVGQGYRRWASTVMIDEGKILMTGGTASKSADTPALNTALLFDISAATPRVTRAANMRYSRAHHTSVLLPTGEVLVLGGNGRGTEFDDNQSRLTPELYDASTNRWRSLAAMSVPRNYHSTGTLLADGRVLMAGGGLCGDCAVNHQDAQTYTPPYLFDSSGALAERPVISGAPGQLGYNQSFTINVSGARASNITSFSLIKLSANTHAMNSDLRRLELSFTKNGATYRATTSANPNVLTPGYYYLFAVNDRGVPSVAKTVQIN